MRPQPLIIHLRNRADAECVAEALPDHAATVEETPAGWDVRVPTRSALGDVLSAVHACLLDNDIPMVWLTLDEKRYAMEAVARE